MSDGIASGAVVAPAMRDDIARQLVSTVCHAVTPHR
jgi:hypothetical protein